MLRKIIEKIIEILSYPLPPGGMGIGGNAGLHRVWRGLVQVTHKELANQLGITTATFEWIASAYGVKIERYFKSARRQQGCQDCPAY